MAIRTNRQVAVEIFESMFLELGVEIQCWFLKLGNFAEMSLVLQSSDDTN